MLLLMLHSIWDVLFDASRLLRLFLLLLLYWIREVRYFILFRHRRFWCCRWGCRWNNGWSFGWSFCWSFCRSFGWSFSWSFGWGFCWSFCWSFGWSFRWSFRRSFRGSSICLLKDNKRLLLSLL